MLIAQITKVEPKSFQENLKNQIKWVLLGEQLIIGNFMDHTDMVMEALHPNLDFKEAMDKSESYRGQVVAAGIANKDGSMDSWESTGFGKITPPYLREELGDAVKKIILEEPAWH